MFRGTILSFTAVTSFLFPEVSQAQTSVVDRLAPDQPPLLMAHLGNGGGFREGGYPENSLAAIRHAIEMGVDGVYMPVHITQDGRYVLMHDANLNTTTNVERVFPDGPASRSKPFTAKRVDFISDYTLAEIRRLRLTDGQDGGVHPVPTLEDALALIDGRVLVEISLKSYELDSLSAVLEANEKDNLLVFALDAKWTQQISAATGIKAEATLEMSYRRDPVAGLDTLAEMLGPALVLAYSVDPRQLTPELLEKASSMGIRVGIFPRAEDYYLSKGNVTPWKEILKSGATVFMTDHPGAILELMGR